MTLAQPRVSVKLETITLLYQALVQQNPDLAGMDYWANQNYTEQQLANLAYTNRIIAQRSFDTLDAQAGDRNLGWLWGAPAVTDALIKVVTDYISADGAWADGVLVEFAMSNFRAALEDSNGNLNLIQVTTGPKAAGRPTPAMTPSTAATVTTP